MGATQATPISARVLAATNRDLAAMVEQGKFRKDLFFRLNVVNRRIPPPAERRGDIPLLAMHFLTRMEKETGVERTLSDDSLRLMADYDWPGNAGVGERDREGMCSVERAGASSGRHADPASGSSDAARAAEAAEEPQPTQDAHRAGWKPEHASGRWCDRFDCRAGEAGDSGTIQQLHGDKLLAAKLLGIGKTTLYRKLKEYGITEIPEE